MKQAARPTLKPMAGAAPKQAPKRRHKRRRTWWKTFLLTVVALGLTYTAVVIVLAYQAR